MKKEFRVWAMTFIVLWWLAPNEIFCQQDSLDQQYLDEVVISAGKFSKKRAENGRVVVIISYEEIERSGSRDIGQLLHARAGIYVNGANGAPSKDRGIYLRGSAPQYSLILIDGIPLYDPAGVNGVFDLRLLSLANVQRIEILKGSQSTLYGTDAMSGVINIITRKGEEGFHSRASFSYGSYDQLTGDAGLSGKVGKVSYSAGYRYWGSSGISEARAPEGKSFDEDPFSQHAFNSSVNVEISPRISISPFLQFSKMNGEYDAGAFTDAPDNMFDAENLRYGLNVNAVGKNPWQVQVAHNRISRKFSAEYGNLESVGSLWHAEAFYTHNFSKRWRVLGGFMIQEQKITSEEIPDAQIVAPYLSAFFTMLDGLILEGGIRLNHHSQFGNSLTLSVNPSWQVSSNWKVFANYTTGFKAPTLSQLYGQFGPNPDLKPEISRSAEAGISWYSAGSDIRLSIFSRRIDDIIIYTDHYSNSDRQDVSGAEMESSIRLTDHLALNARYTFLNGKTSLFTSDSTFNGILRQPDHAFSIGINYSPTARWEFQADGQYFGKRTDLYFDSSQFTSRQVQLDPYALVNFRAGYALAEHLWLRLSINNVLASDYYEVYGYSVLGRNFHAGLSWSM